MELQEHVIRRAYRFYSPVYDVLFDWVFRPGREAAIEALDLEPGQRVLEVGVGTGLNLPSYPSGVEVVGIDISDEMMQKARVRAAGLGPDTAVRLEVMDAARMAFPDASFDAALATYTISAVPDPVATLREIERVVKPGCAIIILNHFRSENEVVGRCEDFIEPLCHRLGWKSNLPLRPVFSDAGLELESVRSVNLLNAWQLVTCRADGHRTQG